MERRPVPESVHIQAPADSLDSVSFYEQYAVVMEQGLAAINAGDVQATADATNEMARLRLNNPRLTQEHETRRWEDTDKDL